MQIFATTHLPDQCAAQLDDRRVVNQILETTQIMSGAARLNGYEGDDLYKITHEHHPIVKWVASSRDAYEWTLSHLVALHNEWRYRFEHPDSRTHKSLERCYATLVECAELLPESEEPLVFCNCAANSDLDIDFTGKDDVHRAYRRYLSARWDLEKESDSAPGPRWRLRGPPQWYSDAKYREDMS